MSVDYFLYSPSNNRSASIGSVGFSGTQVYPSTKDCLEFIRWAIDENIKDVVLIDEDRLFALEELHDEED